MPSLHGDKVYLYILTVIKESLLFYAKISSHSAESEWESNFSMFFEAWFGRGINTYLSLKWNRSNISPYNWCLVLIKYDSYFTMFTQPRHMLSWCNNKQIHIWVIWKFSPRFTWLNLTRSSSTDSKDIFTFLFVLDSSIQ